MILQIYIRRNFNPRSPHGERLGLHVRQGATKRFQPTLPARGATALDTKQLLTLGQFQPTLPARGATTTIIALSVAIVFQPTLPARGATATREGNAPNLRFQPTLPARGATKVRIPREAYCIVFQPTLPARGATGGLDCFHLLLGISTHAPRTGSDTSKSEAFSRVLYFNPRSPHGERLGCVYNIVRKNHFNPRSPHGERRMQQSAFRSR